MKKLFLVVGILICLVSFRAFAARKDKPTGKEIADKAKVAEIDQANATTGEIGAKKVKLTPAVPRPFKNEADLEDGQVIGLLETEASGDESPLAPGRYNLFLAKVDNTWHVYAESDGRIVGEAMQVNVEKTDKPSDTKPEFRAKGWCFLLHIAGWYVCRMCF
jgi:hypothetical protein